MVNETVKIKIDGKELYNIINSYLTNQYLVIARDGSLCLMEQNERFVDNALELFRIRLCTNLEEHNNFIEVDDDANNDLFYEVIEEMIYDKVDKYNRENEEVIEIKVG